jgi:biopolymer transport protein ExbD
MAIVTPGKRPCKRIAASKVYGKKFARGKKSGYAELMLTSLVDMFTIIVIFLLQNFSASGDILYMSKDIKLPFAVHGVELERAPVIAVSADAVTVDGKQVAQTDDLAKRDVLNVPELEDSLREEKRRYEQIHANDPEHPFRGLVNVQADKKIPFKVIKKVMFACNQSGFGNISFAAMAKGGGGAPKPGAAAPAGAAPAPAPVN